MLYEFITAHRDEVLSRAHAKVSARLFPAVSKDELESGLPLFLTQLAETLRLQSTTHPFSPTAIGISAGKHGIDLLGKGWTIGQVVHDYGDICQGITEAAVDQRVGISSEEFKTLNFCLDNAIASAVTEFSRQRDLTVVEGEAERLGRLTHELRNMLSTAMLSYEAVKSGRVAIGGSTGAILGRSLTGLSDLIDTAISGVLLAAGAHEMRRIPLAGFLREVQTVASMRASQRGMDLEFGLPPDDVAVDADPQLLSSALFNLLQNAFKYSVPHGRVAVRATCDNKRVSIQVQDECGGLPEGSADALFQSFAERRGKDRAGMGLGLSISRKAVKALGGDIRVRNLPGKGCIFSIELPLAPERPAVKA